MTDIELKIARIADELANWRKNTGIPEGQALTSAQRSQLIDFTYDCIDRMGYELPANRSNATVIPYTGAMTVNGVTKNVWEIVMITLLAKVVISV